MEFTTVVSLAPWLVLPILELLPIFQEPDAIPFTELADNKLELSPELDLDLTELIICFIRRTLSVITFRHLRRDPRDTELRPALLIFGFIFQALLGREISAAGLNPTINIKLLFFRDTLFLRCAL